MLRVPVGLRTQNALNYQMVEKVKNTITTL